LLYTLTPSVGGYTFLYKILKSKSKLLTPRPILYVVLIDLDKLKIVINFVGEKENMNYFTKL